MTTNVTFEIYAVQGDDVVEISEESLAESCEQYRPFLRTSEVLEGALVITADGQDPLSAIDELWAAVQNLCFTCPVALLEEKRESFLYRFTSSAEQIVASAQDSKARLLGSDGTDITIPQSELFPALYACGERFLQFLSRLKGPEDVTLQHLRPFANRARAVLQAHGMATF